MPRKERPGDFLIGLGRRMNFTPAIRDGEEQNKSYDRRVKRSIRQQNAVNKAPETDWRSLIKER